MTAAEILRASANRRNMISGDVEYDVLDGSILANAVQEEELRLRTALDVLCLLQ